MGGSKKPSLPKAPDAPKYQEDPLVGERVGELYGLGKQLTKGDFSGDLAGLQEVVNTSPQMTTLFLQGLKAQLDPIYSDMRRETTNRLAASNQLESSVLPSAMADIEKNQQNQYIQQSTAFGINDINRAMQNRMSLFGTGVNTMGAGAGMTFDMQNAKNQFAMNNYSNAIKKYESDVAASLYSQKSGGGWGQLAGTLIGGIAGTAMGGNTMLGAQLGGGLGSMLNF